MLSLFNVYILPVWHSFYIFMLTCKERLKIYSTYNFPGLIKNCLVQYFAIFNYLIISISQIFGLKTLFYNLLPLSHTSPVSLPSQKILYSSSLYWKYVVRSSGNTITPLQVSLITPVKSGLSSVKNCQYLCAHFYRFQQCLSNL